MLVQSVCFRFTDRVESGRGGGIIDGRLVGDAASGVHGSSVAELYLPTIAVTVNCGPRVFVAINDAKLFYIYINR